MEIDCGDNSCLFAPSKTGMRTNGGCRCFANAGFHRSATMAAKQMLPELLRLREGRQAVDRELLRKACELTWNACREGRDDIEANVTADDIEEIIDRVLADAAAQHEPHPWTPRRGRTAEWACDVCQLDRAGHDAAPVSAR